MIGHRYHHSVNILSVEYCPEIMVQLATGKAARKMLQFRFINIGSCKDIDRFGF